MTISRISKLASTILTVICLGALIWAGFSAIATDPVIATSPDGIAQSQDGMSFALKLAAITAAAALILNTLSRKLA